MTKVTDANLTLAGVELGRASLCHANRSGVEDLLGGAAPLQNDWSMLRNRLTKIRRASPLKYKNYPVRQDKDTPAA